MITCPHLNLMFNNVVGMLSHFKFHLTIILFWNDDLTQQQMIIYQHINLIFNNVVGMLSYFEFPLTIFLLWNDNNDETSNYNMTICKYYIL